MRFTRKQRHPEFEDTRRKRLALARKQRLERERFPLLADLITETQPDADAVMAERAISSARWEQDQRQRQADLWRKARRRIETYGDNVRALLRKRWNEAPYPGHPGYLLDMLHSFDVGRLDLDNPPWVYRGAGLRAVDFDAIVAAAQARREKAA